MRSKLAISALIVTSLFGSTLIASAQMQPAPGASSEGNVGPGATPGKKTKHEKGMTTGSSTRSGLISTTITWLLRNAAKSTDILSRGGCTSRAKAPEQSGASLLKMHWRS